MFHTAGESGIIDSKIVSSIFDKTKLVIPVQKEDNEIAKED